MVLGFGLRNKVIEKIYTERIGLYILKQTRSDALGCTCFCSILEFEDFVSKRCIRIVKNLVNTLWISIYYITKPIAHPCLCRQAFIPQGDCLRTGLPPWGIGVKRH